MNLIYLNCVKMQMSVIIFFVVSPKIETKIYTK